MGGIRVERLELEIRVEWRDQSRDPNGELSRTEYSRRTTAEDRVICGSHIVAIHWPIPSNIVSPEKLVKTNYGRVICSFGRVILRHSPSFG